MRPHLALFFSLGLSFFCLREDAKQQKSISPAIWLPVLWMMRCASRAIGLWFDSGGISAMDSDAGLLDPLVLLGLTILGITILWQRRNHLRLLSQRNAFLLIFLGYMTISVLWSGDIFVSFKRWVRAAGDITMALIVLTEANPFSALICVLRRSFVALIPLSLVLCKYFPDLGRLTSKSWDTPDSWIGVTTDKNWLGVLCFLASAYFLWNWLMRRRKTGLGIDIRIARIPFEIPFLGMSLFLLMGGGGGRSKSMTAIVMFLFSIAVFVALDYCRTRRISFIPLIAKVFIVGLFLNGAAHLITNTSLPDLVIEAMGRNPTLTDRTDFWPFLLEKGMEHPLFGSGFDSFWTPEMSLGVKNIIQIAITQAHNGFLEIFLNLGGFGLLFLILALYGALKDSNQLLKSNFEYGRVRLILLFCVLLDNWTEASFGRPTELVWFIFLLTSINTDQLPDMTIERTDEIGERAISVPA